MRHGAHSERELLSPGMRVLIRGQEWLVDKVEPNSLGNHAVSCTGISALVRDMTATFLDDLDTITPVDPVKTRFIPDTSARAAKSHLFIESLLRATAPTDARIHVGNKAAMDSLPYQLVPAKKALAQPRQRILIADAVGLGKTLEAGILMSELIKRRKGRRILVVTAKSMMVQFQKEMWERFTIPLISLDSSRIQQIRSEIPANANPFSYYDKVIISIDTLKRDIQYGAALDASYWDIIVIDEAQNVADRAANGRSAQRAKLAKRLASRSDTLIMLSATPHDGRARSFASLMNMLDPTTLPDPERYDKKDVEHLYVRRFKKDVMAEVSGSFPERKVTQEKCKATAAEEEAFDYLTDMKLVMDMHQKRSNSFLFKTMLEKSLFSSPAACIKTIDERVKRLAKKDVSDQTGDIDRLEGLKAALEKIGPMQFSRYQRLLQLLRSADYGWHNGEDADDRIVIFTERIETKNYLEEHLRQDLKLPKKAIVSMDGGMSDVEQQKIVEDFGTKSSSIRILVASDVASEGLNLHYLSHRLIHFDTPWSLMVFQQRNGRIDRYGQRKQPDIRFMMICSRNAKIQGDTHILEILQQKEDQARKDIGDPSLLMGKFDVDQEEEFTREAIESGESAEDFAARLRIPDEDIDHSDERSEDVETVPDDDVFDPLSFFNLTTLDGSDTTSTEENEPAGESVTGSADDGGIVDSSTLMSDYEYVDEGLSCEEFRQSAGLKSKRQLRDAHGFAVEFQGDSPLRAWLRRRVPNTQVLRDNIAEWSDDAKYCEGQANGLLARINDESWSRVQYLWELNPITEWVGLKAFSLLYQRDEAPIIGVTNGNLHADETIMLMNGMVANRHASPVIDEWFGVRYLDGECMGMLPLEEVWRITGYRGNLIPGTTERRYVNREDSAASSEQIDAAQLLLEDAVSRGKSMLSDCGEQYRAQADEEVTRQMDRIERWSHARKALLQSQGKNTKENTKQVDRMLEHYADWVQDTLDASGEPVIRIAAAFVGKE